MMSCDHVRADIEPCDMCIDHKRHLALNSLAIQF